MEKQPVSDRYCKHSTQVNITSHWTELVEMSMLDHVFDANFCCDAVVAKASSLFNTCIIPHNQYSTLHCTSCLQPVSIQLVLVSRFASKCVCVCMRACACASLHTTDYLGYEYSSSLIHWSLITLWSVWHYFTDSLGASFHMHTNT